MDNSKQTRQVAPNLHAGGRWRLYRNPIVKWIERALLIIGLALAAFVGAAYLESYISTREALEIFDAAVSSDPAPAVDISERDGLQQEEREDSGETQSLYVVQNPSSTSREPLAVLEIPMIRLSVPVFEGTDPLTLNHGVGRIRGTGHPGDRGNIGIAGHRDRYFRRLKDLHSGDLILLRTRGGIDTYSADRFQVVSPREVQVLQSTAIPSVTLVTCYPFYFVGNAPKRFVVTAHLMHSSSVGPTATDARPFIETRNSTQEKP